MESMLVNNLQGKGTLISKIIIMLVLSFSCYTYTQYESTEHIEIKEDNVIIIGRVLFDFEIKQTYSERSNKPFFYNKYYIISSEEPDPYLGKLYNRIFPFITCNKNSYFIVRISKEDLFFCCVVYPIDALIYYDITFTLKLNPQEGDRYIYIGDIVFSFDDNDIVVNVVDNFDTIPDDKRFIVSVNNEIIQLGKNLIKGSSYAEIKMFEYYYSGIIIQ